MKAIVTKFVPPTNTKGSRIRAYAEGLKALTIAWDYDLTEEKNHAAAARALANKYDWASPLQGGCTRNGYVWVFVNSGIRA